MKKQFATLAIFIVLLSATLRTQIVRTAGTEPRKVGVKVGDWAEYEIACNYTSNDPNPPQYPGKLATEMVSTKVTVLEVNGTKIKFEEIYRFKNGTELYETKSTDLSECYQLGVWFILPNLDPGDTVIQCPTSPVINATLTQEHCGVVREVNCVYQHLKYWSAPNHEADSITHMYWDKYTGFQVEANGSIYITELTEGYITDVFVHLLINETNIWKPDIIVPDDYPSIQQAINAANENDTIFVRNGTYYEHVVVNKTVSLIGGNREATIIDGSEIITPIVHITADNVTVRAFTIQNSGRIYGWEGGGIYITDSNRNNIVENTITNTQYGINLRNSTSNTIIGNTIMENDVGIQFLDDYSSNSTIYHNNIIDNGWQVNNFAASNNTWDNSYPSGGNYWSDYDGIDTHPDAIGDSWYEIDENNIDHYPLMGMFSSFNTSLGYHVNVISNSTIGNFQYFESNSTIRMYASNMTASQTYGFCRIRIPHALMSEPYNVTVDGANPTYWNYTLYDDGDNRWIYFSYEHSTLEIIIIPEFQSTLIMPLFMIISMLAVALAKRKEK